MNYSLAYRMLATFCFFAGLAWGQPPAIFQGAVVNAASQMHPALPGGAIARGALFTIRGLRFGSDAAALSIRISQESKSVAATVLKLQTLAPNSQVIQARMPSDAPLGQVDLRLARGDEESRPFLLEVAASAFGIESQNASDWGQGRIYKEHSGKRLAVSYTDPARYGERLVLAGTGLGDETKPEILVGGFPADVLGVTSKAGEDEIAFSVPPKVPVGCAVPLFVRVHKQLVSNVVSLALNDRAGPCRDLHHWPSPGAATGKTGSVVLATETHSELILKNGIREETTTDDAAALFLRVSPRAPGGALLHPLPPPGTCAAYSRPFEGQVVLAGPMLLPIVTAMNGGYLNAGREMDVEGSQGPRRIFQDSRALGYYYSDLGGTKPGSLIERPLFFLPGEIRISGQGGADVGPFSVALRTGGKFEWTNRSEIRTVARSAGVTLEWKGLDADRILGVIAVNVDPETGAMGSGFCLAPQGSTSITIPPAILSNLPSSKNVPGIPYDFVALVSLPDHPIPFLARGLDAGYGMYVYIEGKSVDFR